MTKWETEELPSYEGKCFICLKKIGEGEKYRLGTMMRQCEPCYQVYKDILDEYGKRDWYRFKSFIHYLQADYKANQYELNQHGSD